MVVDLPAPFGPRKPWTCPGVDLEVEAVEGADAAVALDEVRRCG